LLDYRSSVSEFQKKRSCLKTPRTEPVPRR
jgi:hypothetical protein